MSLAAAPRCALTRSQAWQIYLLHAFTAATSRTYDFAAIVFTASLFPNGMTAASIRGVSTTLACVFLSPAIGTWVDACSSRLYTLSVSIWVQQSTTVLAYALWFLADLHTVGINDSHDRKLQQGSDPGAGNVFLFMIVVFVGMFVKLGAVANDLVIDREWLPVLVPSSMSSESEAVQYDLTHLNAVLRRIDLACKIITPFIFDFLISLSYSAKLAVFILLAISILSGFAELNLANRVYNSNSALQAPKDHQGKHSAITSSTNDGKKLTQTIEKISKLVINQVHALRLYFATNVWIPSFAWTLLHFTILAYSASLITYLLEIGFTLPVITIAQSTGSAMEVASTFVTPWLIHKMSRRSRPSDNQQEDESASEHLTSGRREIKSDPSTLETVGLYGISWQFCCLIAAVGTLFYSSRNTASTESPHPSSFTLPSLVLFSFLTLSRGGFWAYELTTQELTQTLVPAAELSSFAGTQQSFQSFFELLHWIMTAIWSSPDTFPFLALASLCAIGTAVGIYTYWVWQRRARRKWEGVHVSETAAMDYELEERDEEAEDEEK